MTYFAFISYNYGTHVKDNMKTAHSDKIKLAKALNKQIFLLKLRQHRIVPKNRRIKNIYKINENKFNKIENRFHMAVISQEIGETLYKISNLKAKINKSLHTIKDNIPLHLFNDFNDDLNKKYEFIFNETKDKQCTKFKKLLNKN